MAFDIKKWNIANAHLEKLKRVNYSEKHYDSILKKFFQDKNELNSFMSWSRNKMDNQKKYSQNVYFYFFFN